MKRPSLHIPEPRRLVKPVGYTLLFLLAVVVLTGVYWSREPKRFDVLDIAKARIGHPPAEEREPAFPPGYVLVSTQMHLVENLLNKPGGYLVNDKLPPGTYLDNIPSWEFGVLTQVRDMARVIRDDYTRSQSQSSEDPDVTDAVGYFFFDRMRDTFAEEV